MICQPCKVDDHDNCTPAIGAMSLGMQDECLCWRYGEVHEVPATPSPVARSNWTDEENRDRAHDRGEDEFDNWIADSARALEEIGGT